MKKNRSLPAIGLVNGCLLAAGLLLATGVQAQDEKGKIEETEIVVEKDRKIELPTANRNFDKLKLTPPPKETRKLEYTLNDIKLPNQPIATSMRVLTIKQEELSKLYGNYVRAGFGNYTTPFFQAFLHNNRSDKYSIGAALRHINSTNGPVLKNLSGATNSAIDVNGETYLNEFTLGGKVFFEHDRLRYYGLREDALKDSTEDDIKQIYNRFGGMAFLNNHNGEAALKYNVGLGYQYWKDKFDATEGDFLVEAGLGYALSKTSQIKVESNASFIQENNVEKISRPYFRVRPYYQATFGKLNLTVGGTLAYAKEGVDSVAMATELRPIVKKTETSVTVYPHVNIGYEILENKLSVFAGVTGDLERQSRFKLTRENPWLASSFNVPIGDSLDIPTDFLRSRVLNTDRQLDVYGGLRGNISTNIVAQIKGGYQRYRNLYFYANSITDSSRFTLAYDSAVTTAITVSGEVAYNAGDRIRIGLKADYYKWDVGNVLHTDKALQRPDFQANLFSTYQLYKKIFLTADFYYIGSASARNLQGDFDSGEMKLRKTDAVYDLSLKVDYKITDRFSAWVSGSNLLGKKYQRYLYYPTRGIQALVGVSYTF